MVLALVKKKIDKKLYFIEFESRLLRKSGRSHIISQACDKDDGNYDAQSRL